MLKSINVFHRDFINSKDFSKKLDFKIVVYARCNKFNAVFKRTSPFSQIT